MQHFRYLDEVSTLSLDRETCIGCAMCTLVCPHGVFALNGKKAKIVDRNGCMECGACAKNCPVHCIGVKPGVGCAAYIIQTWIKGKDKVAVKCC